MLRSPQTRARRPRLTTTVGRRDDPQETQENSRTASRRHDRTAAPATPAPRSGAYRAGIRAGRRADPGADRAVAAAPGRPDAHGERDRRAARDEPHGRARGDQDPLSARADQGAEGPRALRRRRRRDARRCAGAASSCRPTSITSTCSSSSAASRNPRRAASPPPGRHPTELRAIEAAAQTVPGGHATGQPELFRQGDDEFHLSIAAASHNPFLVAAVREARRLLMQSPRSGCTGHSAATRPKRSKSRRDLPGEPDGEPATRPMPPPCTWITRWRTTAGRSGAAYSAASRASGRTRRR